ncbi:MAG TPA: hypothetical protein VMR98_02265 [Candidatus Polarisedimenticolaceae bacterium]|nr:hypothetical protein [Candidatus Polarisedimenticolaceae bacterium]
MTEVIIVGSLILLAVLLGAVTLWVARMKPKKGKEEPGRSEANQTPVPGAPPEPLPYHLPELTQAEKERLEQAASKAFEAAVNGATDRFGKSLDETSGRLNDLITRLTTGIVEKELEQYRQNVDEARKAALASLANMQTTVESQQQKLQADIDQALAERRAYLLERLDKNLGQAVSAYLVESLGQAADLGAQRAFLLESLERHKADLKSEFGDGS